MDVPWRFFRSLASFHSCLLCLLLLFVCTEQLVLHFVRTLFWGMFRFSCSVHVLLFVVWNNAHRILLTMYSSLCVAQKKSMVTLGRPKKKKSRSRLWNGCVFVMNVAYFNKHTNEKYGSFQYIFVTRLIVLRVPRWARHNTFNDRMLRLLAFELRLHYATAEIFCLCTRTQLLSTIWTRS